jgi:hypothetical protein
MDDETMQDIALFFESGFYSLDRERTLTVQTHDKNLLTSV